MGNDLKALVEKLVSGDGSDPMAGAAGPATEVVESDSEDAWNDFQDSQLAFDKAFKTSEPGSL